MLYDLFAQSSATTVETPSMVRPSTPTTSRRRVGGRPGARGLSSQGAALCSASAVTSAAASASRRLSAASVASSRHQAA